jgi:hypothetical protein
MQTLDLNPAKLRLSRVSLLKNLHTATPLAKDFQKELAQVRESGHMKLARAMNHPHLRGSKAGKSPLTPDHAKNCRPPRPCDVTRDASDWRLYSPKRIRSWAMGRLAPN